MRTIFQWLKSRHVKSVIEIIVSDEVEPSHSDEAIEDSLKDLDVKIWNWQRTDLCSEVIVKTAPNVEEISLCSSGSNAVLVGWSSPSGLPKLKKLRKVHLLVREGLEKPGRLRGYIAAFETELRDNVRAAQEKRGQQITEIDFSSEIFSSKRSFFSVYTESRIKTLTLSPWMKCMKDFAGFLRSAKSERPINPIKIAVIDDGINMGLDIFHNRVQSGESFYRFSNISGRCGSYYVPSGPHGTLMAQLICEVCPQVKLFIAQLEELRGREGRRSFSVESAAGAIRWATLQDVDIISMSWSIDTTATYKDLDTALENAAKQGIVMLCSSIDNGPNAVDNTYPSKTGRCIKIGASTGKGTILSWVTKDRNIFLAPGEGIQPIESHMWPQGSDPIGSSVSTALAAGLAGVLLYCDRLLSTRKDEPAAKHLMPPISAQNRGIDVLRYSNNMKIAFGNLSTGPDNEQFLQVWDYFPKKLNADKWADVDMFYGEAQNWP
ncbi:peptidase S8/S53 domain-containing protein [Whalleya microplaca]|nr:peptidase S8/S53 domain-containing protein [Whalleya microplaca]